MTANVHLAGSAGVVSAVPSILGFHPSESLVVVTLIERDGTRILGPVARVDLGYEDIAGLGRSLRQHAQQAVVVVYSADLHAVFEVDTAALGLDILDVVATGNARQSLHPELAAANALRGRGVLTGREQLEASIAYDPERRRDALDDELLADLHDLDGRDRFILDHLAAAADAVPDLVHALVTVGPGDPVLANLASTLAILAYRAGDGALANAAIDRAPLDPLNRLLIAHIGAGLSPDDLHAALAGGS